MPCGDNIYYKGTRMSQADFSIIIPAFREAEAIGNVVRGVLRQMAVMPQSGELLVVDDGSDDNTAVIAAEAGAQVYRHPYNKGYGAALKTGIRAACGKTVIFFDADGQHHPEDIPKLLEGRLQYDMMVGARPGTAGSPLWRKPGKKILAFVVNQLVGRKVPDFNCGLRALDRQLALRILPIMPDGFSFSTTSTIACFRGGFNVGYAPVAIQTRLSGVSSVTWYDGLKTLLLIIRLITIFAPLRIILPICVLTFLVGAWYIIQSYLLLDQASVKGLLMILASIIIFVFGSLLDQISAIRRGETITDLRDIL